MLLIFANLFFIIFGDVLYNCLFCTNWQRKGRSSQNKCIYAYLITIADETKSLCLFCPDYFPAESPLHIGYPYQIGLISMLFSPHSRDLSFDIDLILNMPVTSSIKIIRNKIKLNINSISRISNDAYSF